MENDDEIKRKVPHSQHLTMVDLLRKGFQPPEHQMDFLREQAAKRKAEADAEARRKGRDG